MSDDLLAIFITFGILVALFLWVPTLDFCGPRCQRILLARRAKKAQYAAQLLKAD